nr:hypothetical protein [Planctomycetota bacterium]
LKRQARREQSPCHQAPTFGAVCAALGMARIDAQRLYLFLHLRGLVSSAVRLSLIGPLAAQALQHRAGAIGEQVLARCADLGPEDAASTAPLLDIYQGHHDRLYSRLFGS